jgi:membrane-bound inhibitor of C-type lysozyme
VQGRQYDRRDLLCQLGRSEAQRRQKRKSSGARYANKDETFVFWNKGDTAFVTEG